METFSSFTTVFEKLAKGEIRAKVFNDALNFCIYDFSTEPCTGHSIYSREYQLLKSHYEKKGKLEYLQALPKALMDHANKYRVSNRGPDLLGEFYETTICCRKSGYLLPAFEVEMMMADMMIEDFDKDNYAEHFFDPLCQTGRLFLAISRKLRRKRLLYYGLEFNPYLAKCAILNLFLNGLNGEVHCGNIHIPGDCSFGYRVSSSPDGIFKVCGNEASMLRHIRDFVFSEITKSPVKEKVIRYFQF